MVWIQETWRISARYFFRIENHNKILRVLRQASRALGRVNPRMRVSINPVSNRLVPTFHQTVQTVISVTSRFIDLPLAAMCALIVPNNRLRLKPLPGN